MKILFDRTVDDCIQKDCIIPLNFKKLLIRVPTIYCKSFLLNSIINAVN